MSESLTLLFEGAVAKDKAGEGGEAMRLLDTLLEYQQDHRLGLFYRGGVKVRYRKDVEGAAKDWELAFDGAPEGASSRVQQKFPLLLDSCLERMAQLTGLEPHNPVYHSAFGRACLLFGRPDQAERHLDRALALDKTRWIDAIRLSDLYLSQGKREDAHKLLQEQAQISPEVGEVHYALGLYCFRQKLVAQALRSLEAATKLNPRHLGTRKILSEIYLTQGRVEQAQSHFEFLLEAAPSAAVHLGMAECDKQQFRFEEALQHYKKAVELEPRNFLALKELGSMAVQFGDLATGVSALKTALEVEPGHSDIFGQLAKAAIQQGNSQEAIAALRMQLKHDPGDGYAAYALATQLRASGSFAEACQLLEKVSQSREGDVQVCLELSDCYVQLNRPAEALALLCDAYERNPMREDLKLALQKLAPNAASQPVPSRQPDLDDLVNLARAHLQANRQNEAFETFRKVLSLCPDHSEALLQVGRLYLGRKMMEPASECLLRSYLGKPQEYTTLLELFAIMYQMPDATGRAFLIQLATRLPQFYIVGDCWLDFLWSHREQDGVKRWLHNLMAAFPADHPLSRAWGKLRQASVC